jgi:hypothetical protein
MGVFAREAGLPAVCSRFSDTLLEPDATGERPDATDEPPDATEPLVATTG